MFHDDNYQRGSRRWILHTEDVVLNCVLVIEQLQRATDYLKVALDVCLIHLICDIVKIHSILLRAFSRPVVDVAFLEQVAARLI